MNITTTTKMDPAYTVTTWARAFTGFMGALLNCMTTADIEAACSMRDAGLFPAEAADRIREAINARIDAARPLYGYSGTNTRGMAVLVLDEV